MSLLTVRQAAERLGVGYSTLKHWIYDGRVRTRVTGGGHHRIEDAEVDRLLAPAAGAAARKAPIRSGLIVSISGRNQLRGYVDEVRVEGLLAQVRLRIGDQTLTAVITADAVRALKLRRGADFSLDVGFGFDGHHDFFPRMMNSRPIPCAAAVKSAVLPVSRPIWPRLSGGLS